MSTGQVPSRPHRLNAWLVIGALAFMVGCAYVVYSLVGLRQSLDSERQSQVADSTAISQLSSALTTTRDQLQQHGVTPKAPPPTEIVEGVPGATGPAGESIVGPQGPPGKDAPTPNPTTIASLAAGLVHPSPGPSGPAGPQGAPGQNSNVPGPQGPAGQQGPPPSSWTWKWTDPSGVTHTYACTQAPAGSTSYSCTETGTSTPAPPPASPSPTPTATSGPGQAKPRPKTVAVSTGPR